MWAEIVVGKFIFQLAQAVRIRTGPVYWSCLNGNLCTVVVARQANGPQAPTASAGLPFASSDYQVEHVRSLSKVKFTSLKLWIDLKIGLFFILYLKGYFPLIVVCYLFLYSSWSISSKYVTVGLRSLVNP